MKRTIFFIMMMLSFQYCVLSSPSNSISIPNDLEPHTLAQSADVDANFNEIQTKYNAHTHTDITSLGTVTTGVWQGTVIDESYGGTAQSSFTTGDILYSNATDTLAKLGIGSTNQALIVSSGKPAWSSTITASFVGGLSGTLNTYNTSTSSAANKIPVMDGSGYMPDSTVDFTALSTLGVQAKIVAYTGNGSSQAVAHGLSTTPSLVLIDTISASEGATLWITGFGTSSKDLSNAVVLTTAITSVDTTNVNVGNGNANQNGREYKMFVLAIR